MSAACVGRLSRADSSAGDQNESGLESRPTPILPAIHRDHAAAPIDWNRFAALVRWHGIAPLVHRALKQAGERSDAPIAPPDLLQELHASTVVNAVSGTKLHRELLRLLSLLRDAGAPALPYKGTALAHLAFGGVALRQTGDIDLIVRQSDFFRVKSLLCASGYHPIVAMPQAEEEAYVASPKKYHFPFLSDSGGAEIEVHWSLTMRSYRFWWLDPARLWERAAELDIGGERILHSSLEDTLAILSVHGSTHYWSRLKWICDLAFLIDRRPDLDLAAALARAGDLRCRRRLLLGLLAARELLGSALPPAINEAISADRSLPGLLARIEPCLERMEEPYDAGLMLEMADGQSGKLAYYLQKAFVPTDDDRKFLPLPPPLRFLHWGVRPLRLAIRAMSPRR